MEEKILIKSEQYNVKKICGTIICIGLIVLAILFFTLGLPEIINYGADSYFRIEPLDDLEGVGMLFTTYYYFSFAVMYGLVIPCIIAGIVYGWMKSYELTISDKRIYGKVAWGKRVDLPVDLVSATSTTRFLKGIAVSTPSGKISFLLVKNAEEVYNVINNLLVERQQSKVDATVVTTTPKSDEADQIKKYKDLLDSGVITQEEFDAKKKQLLGL